MFLTTVCFFSPQILTNAIQPIPNISTTAHTSVITQRVAMNAYVWMAMSSMRMAETALVIE